MEGKAGGFFRNLMSAGAIVWALWLVSCQTPVSDGEHPGEEPSRQVAEQTPLAKPDPSPAEAPAHMEKLVERAAAAEEIRSAIVGQWQAATMTVEMPTYGGGQYEERLNVTAENWQQQLGREPLAYTFYEDGGYAEQTPGEPAVTGKWELSGDSLKVWKGAPTPTLYAFRVVFEGERATFFSMLDFDGDGSKDDACRIVAERVE